MKKKFIIKKYIFLIIYFLSTNIVFASPITLSVTNKNNGIAELNFNSPSSGLPVDFLIIRKIPSRQSNWDSIARFSDNKNSYIYNDSISLCNDSVYYQIICLSESSNIADIVITDKELPKTVTIESVSIDQATGNITIHWQPCESFDTKGYVIYKTKSAITYDTIFGRYSTTFPDSVHNYNDVYRISAFDQCYNFCIMSSEKKPFYTYAGYASCDNKITVSWDIADSALNTTDYHYELFVSMNSGPDSLLLTADKTTVSFNYTNFLPQTTYTFYAKAVANNSDATAASVPASVWVGGIPLPAYFSLTNVTAVNNSSVQIDFNVDVSQYFRSCDIYALSSDGITSLVKSIAHKSLSSHNYIVHKTNAHTKNNYCYYAVIIDTCGNSVMMSDTLCTVFLQGNFNNNTSLLTWNLSPLAQECDSSYFHIYRIVNDSTEFIASLPNENGYFYDYTDYISEVKDIYSISYIVDKICPEIGIISRSNEAEVFQEKGKVNVYFPTGFYPQGTGKIFKPFFSVKFGDQYDFYVFDRWGKEVFHTNDAEKGWNGMISGQPAMPGQYGYRLIIVRNGVTTSQVGSVQLIP